MNRKGGFIFSSTIISKGLSLLFSIIIIRILTKEDYGNLMYAYTFISFLMPFMGFGIFQSFLRFAPLQTYRYQKKAIFRYTFIAGIVASVALGLLLILFSPIASFKMQGALYYIIAFSSLILALFIFESVKNYLRIFYLNKSYAKLEILHAVLIFLLGCILTYAIGGFGFILALVLVPLLLSIWLLYRKPILNKMPLSINIAPKKLWIYGIYTSFGGLVSQLIFSVDIISIGNLLEDAKWVAQYKALSLIPFSLLFIPGAIIKTDFVKLVQESRNINYLKNYVRNFMILFLALSVLILLLTYFFGDFAIVYLFGESYLNQSEMLSVFSVGLVGAFVFRVPFGNIMVAIGWTKISTAISVLTLIADIILNYFWIQKWGVMGAAYATSLLLWISGITVFIVFLVYLKRIQNDSL